jgi:hypothetical protein
MTAAPRRYRDAQQIDSQALCSPCRNGPTLEQSVSRAEADIMSSCPDEALLQCAGARPCQRRERNDMGSVLQLYDSRVGAIRVDDFAVRVRFSLAYIARSAQRRRGGGGLWTQEAEMIFPGGAVGMPLPPLPNTIADGFVEVGGVQHDTIRLPFKCRGRGALWLKFVDASTLSVSGLAPGIELLGNAVRVE